MHARVSVCPCNKLMEVVSMLGDSFIYFVLGVWGGVAWRVCDLACLQMVVYWNKYAFFQPLLQCHVPMCLSSNRSHSLVGL